MRKILLAIILLSFLNPMIESSALGENPRINVLVLLDASFSMNEKWKSRTKFEIASEAMIGIIEESFQENSEKHFAFRIFGNQSGMKLNDCSDTKLLVDFEQRNIDEIRAHLSNVHPKGWSPISLSIQEAIKDFEGMGNDINALIFITDGGETCGGDPCQAAKMLHDADIVAMPFVVGLGNSDYLIEDVGCIGSFQQVNTEVKLREGLKKVIDKIDLQTTAEIYFTDRNGNRNETNIPFSFKRSISSKLKDNYVHALSDDNSSDTFVLSAIGDYQLIAHTNPEIVQSDISLVEDKHNTLVLKTVRGYLDLQLLGDRGISDFECIVRDAMSKEIINVQQFNSTSSYLAGTYELEITSFPKTFIGTVEIKGDQTHLIEFQRSGNLLLRNENSLYGSVYVRNGKFLDKVRELYEIKGVNGYTLQPGEYILIYNYTDKKPVETKEYEFKVDPGRVTTIDL